MAEAWKDIPGFVGLYQVSDLGRVRSLDRRVRFVSKRGLECDRFVSGRVLKPGSQRTGYFGVQLGADEPRLIHRLVLEAFVGAGPEMQANHKNGIRSDNRLENLEWVTCGDNHRHSYAKLSRKQHRMTRRVALRARGEFLTFASGAAAARHLGVVPGSIASAAATGRKCKGYEVFYV